MNRRSFPLVCAAFGIVACSPTSKPDAADSSAAFASNRIEVVRRGAGPDLILIPGLASHRDTWSGVADSLDDRYALHLVQVKGFAGLAPDSNASGPVVAPVAEEVARYIRESRLERPAVIGHSMGGTIAMMLAARHPTLPGRIMVVDAPPFIGVAFGPPGTTAETARPAADQLRAQLLAEDMGSPESMLQKMFSEMTRVDSVRPTLRNYLRTSDRNTVANSLHELIVTDLGPELKNIAVPFTALFVIPEKPPLPPDQYEASMRASFRNAPQALLIKIDKSNHFIHIDQPGRFVAEVGAFMRR